ncbi:PAS domain-containing protein [uncultured Hymenobacter sp.]|uniref:PAS domain-containing protein n=1 Tax=uncultured Hymenobacter sp. TaxID=170016 RepID=UPI0035CA2BA5
MVSASLASTDLFQVLLDVSLTGLIVFRPVWGGHETATVLDLAYVQLNPAAQRMLRLPECPSDTFLTLYPNAVEAGIFAFYRDAFLSGQANHFNVNYQADGLDNYFHLAAQRSGDLLLVSFTDTADQPRTAVEEALRASQAREQAALAEANRQRQHLHNVFEQAPAMICIFEGPQHVFQFVNPPYQALVGDRPLVGKPIAEAMPELAGQPIFGLLDQVFQTGETFYATEMLVQLDHANAGATNLEQRYYNFIYQARHDLAGAIDGVLVFAYEVTAQVFARQQVQALNTELANANEELQAANEEIRLNNEDLVGAQRSLRELNQELEARVADRTAQLQTALGTAEQQRAQLQEQQIRLRQIMEKVPASLATLAGPTHRYTFFNDEYLALSGGRAKPARTAAEVFPELVAQGIMGLLDQVYATGEPFIGTEKLVQLFNPDTDQTEPRYVDFLYQPLTDEQGQTQEILSFVMDVTEKVRARQHTEALQAEVLAAAQRLAQQREAFHAVFEQTPALIALLRAPGHRVEYVNPAYQQLFAGRTLVGYDLAQAVPELETQGFIELMDRVYQTGETHFGNEVLFEPPPRAGHAPRSAYYNFTYQAYREASQIAGVSVFAYDVTEQVLARQERAAQQEQLREIFTQAPVAICVFQGPDYVLDVVNPPMAEMLGHPLAELLGQPFFTALPELVTQGLPDLLAEVRQSGIPFVASEQPIRLARHGSGPAGFFNFVYQPLRDAQGRRSAITCVATDVSEQVRARQQVSAVNEQLRAANEQLRAVVEQLTRTNTDLDNFIYTASHDLKAPISNIEGLLHTLQGELNPTSQPSEVSFILELMQGAVDRFTRTIEHLTDVSKLQKEHNRPQIQVPVAAVVEDVRLDLAPLLQQTGGRLWVDVQAVPTVTFSEKNLRSVVYNLISNALKYHHPGRSPEVHVRGRVEDLYHVLEVQDNGLGLDLTREQDVFAMFQRYHTHVEGSGIGLYIIKRMIENAGGRIEVESHLGQGATFTVYFPR